MAERYVRAHLAALGLSRTDLGSLRLQRRTAIPGGAELLGYRQYADGIPSFDGGLRVAVDAAGRVLSVSGAAQPGLSVATEVPTLTAAQAMRRLMDDVGVRRAVQVASGPAGTRRRTEFTSGEAAALVVFGKGRSARLGWQLDLRAGRAAHYAAVVDAASGRILYRANRVKGAANDARVWEQYPGAPNGGTAQLRDLTPWLTPGATDLSGPFAHAWSDTNDNDSGNLGRRPHRAVGRSGHRRGRHRTGRAEASRSRSTSSRRPRTPPERATPPQVLVEPRRSGSWNDNRGQNAVQAFYYVNRFRDHLFAPPISFTGVRRKLR